MGFDVSYAAALLAGLLSFASPCVLPLVPPYLCFLGGVTLEEIAGDRPPDPAARRRVVVAALAFVLGFTTVFVALGASASVLSQVLIQNARWMQVVAGAIIIVFGLHLMGVLRVGFLNRELRAHPEARPTGPIGAFLVGLAFAFGWAPCVGPVLATILTVAAGREEMWEGAMLLTVYSLGIGIPFLAAAAFAGAFLGAMARLRPHMRKIELALGALLVATGLMILTGTFTELGFWLLRTFPSLGQVG